MLAVIDYGSGNLKSVSQALQRAAQTSGLDEEILVTSNPSDLYSAERLVLPGVGAFADCMAGLEKIPGIKTALEDTVVKEGKPFLGICVGMQLMANTGFENGRQQGLSWIEGEVTALPRGAWKVPHMGWNELTIVKSHPVFENIPGQTDFYFVHSYHFECNNSEDCLATTDYGVRICSVVGRDNILGVQFHPEKSQLQGLRFLINFLKWRP